MLEGGAAGGPSGMTSEHLRPLLDNHGTFLADGQELARAETPGVVVDAIRLGRITVLSKPSGGVRGIVSGDIIRRLVARTVAQQLNPEVEKATAPFQFALTTRCGGECVVHAIQAMTDIDPRATVLSVDGIGAFDLISRAAMMEGLHSLEEGRAVLPFVRQFYGVPEA